MKRIAVVMMMVLCAGQAVACLMLPANYVGKSSQSRQEAVVVHDGMSEDLILRINYQLKGEALPDHFAWVITVPNEPDHYAVADAKLFEQMDRLSQQVLQPPLRGYGGYLSLSADGVELGEQVQVGPYAIQPVRGVGPQALVGLNQWLKAHDYPAEDPEHLRYFVENNFTFLCVRITPAKGASSVPEGGALEPLHLSFKTPVPYYPLRFSSMQGVFDVSLHVLTSKPLDYHQSAGTLKKVNWKNAQYNRNVPLADNKQPSALKAVLAKRAEGKKVPRWYYNHLQCVEVNKGSTISQWKEDVTLATKDANERFQLR